MGKKTKGNVLALLGTKVGKIIIGVIILAVVVGGGFITYERVSNSDAKTTKLGLKNIGELDTQVAYCTEVGTLEVSKDLYGITIPFTETKYVYSYDFIIKAGFDFQEIEWEVNENKIVVKLPKAKVTSNEIVLESFKVYHEDESLFNQVSLDEQNDAVAELKKTAEADAIANGLLENARENAEAIIKSSIYSVYDEEVYEIVFEDK